LVIKLKIFKNRVLMKLCLNTGVSMVYIITFSEV
jgi:hypothetical protein